MFILFPNLSWSHHYIIKLLKIPPKDEDIIQITNVWGTFLLSTIPKGYPSFLQSNENCKLFYQLEFLLEFYLFCKKTYPYT